VNRVGIVERSVEVAQSIDYPLEYNADYKA
jgi:hypothetical protein